MKHFIFYGDGNLGDTAIAIMALKRFVEAYDDVEVTMYCKIESYVRELSNLFIHPRYHFAYTDTCKDTYIKTWVGNNIDIYRYRMGNNNQNFVLSVMEHMDDIFQQLGYDRILNGDIKNFRFDFQSILNSKWFGSTEFDILVVNSMPMSGQIDYDESAFVDFVNRHKDLYKIAVTKPIPNVDVFCTQDVGMTLSDIGAIAINCHAVVGINTSPILFSANKWATSKLWVICVYGNTDCVFQNNHITFLQSTSHLRDINVQYR